MEGDPRVEPQLDAFSLTFPLPFRVGFIITLAVWGWGLNLHGLQRAHIDLPALIRYPGRTSPAALSHHLSTYRLATVLSALLAGCLALFWLLTLRDPRRVVDHGWLPVAYLAALAALFAVPLRNLPGHGRRRFLATLRRVSVGGLAEPRDGKFGDVLLADVLTSYARVLGDLFVTACMFASAGGSATDRPDRDCGGGVAVPLLMAVPSAIRLRQCVTEYLRVRDGGARHHHLEESTAAGWGGQHLANALKYATAFPVIVTSAMRRSAEAAGGDAAAGPGLYRAWLLAVTVNSLYSFYWDVTKDWDLTLFALPSSSPASNKPLRAPASSPSHHHHHHQPWGLRPRLAFRLPGLYYAVVMLDLLLRFAWSMKLSPHLDRFSGWEVGIFVVELLEVFRRWVWIFFRAEAEWIRTTSSPVLGLDDVLLGDYREQQDEEGEDEDEDF